MIGTSIWGPEHKSMIKYNIVNDVTCDFLVRV